MTVGASARIRRDALRHNLAAARLAAPGTRVLAVIKADAYGHGIVRAATRLSDADGFAVARLSEARSLRTHGERRPILLLEGVASTDELHEAASLGTMLTVHSEYQVEMLATTRTAQPLSVWLKVDSGMHRLGVPPERAAVLWQRLSHLDTVTGPVRWMTHFSSADDPQDDATARQIARFEAAVGALPGERSLANSAGVLAWPASHGDWIRPGIMLYGGTARVGRLGPDLDLRPAMNLDTRLVAVYPRHKGDTVGYGAAGVCPDDMPVGVAAIGYADGYPRHARQGTPVLVNGHRVALLGRVSMDLVTLDLREVPDAKPGDPVRMWGEGLPADEVAACCGTIAYELFCRVAPRVVFRER